MTVNPALEISSIVDCSATASTVARRVLPREVVDERVHRGHDVAALGRKAEARQLAGVIVGRLQGLVGHVDDS